MHTIDMMAALTFWICSGLAAYTYLGYPVVIWGLSRLFGRRPGAPVVTDDDLPRVTLLLAAYNEAAVIDARLRNALSMDYPAEKLEVLVGSDGSVDGTAEIVRGCTDRRVRLLDFACNRGKASVLNDAVQEARGTLLLMSDANTQIDGAAGRRLARWFQDPTVGAVVGRLMLVDSQTGRNADSIYWKYENFLKQCEGDLGALLGGNGAIYAIRKENYVAIPANTTIDDFLIPLLAKLRTGCGIIYDCQAVAVEETAPNVGSEFRRRARFGAGGYQSIGLLWRLLDPRRGWVAFSFLSHKILRWLCPFFLLGALGANLCLLDRPLYGILLLGQVGFYATSLAMAFVPSHYRFLRPLRLATMFTSMNAALFIGFWRWLFRRQRGGWRSTSRTPETSGVAQ